MPHSNVSIIVPVLNEHPSTLDNLADLAHRGEVEEIIVVDASDQLETIDKLNTLQAQFDRLRVIFTTPPGRARQMNQGVAHAKGRILWFIHADTRVPDGAATCIGDCISTSQPWGRFDVRFSNSSKRMQLVAFAMNLRSALTGVCTGDQAIFISRDLFQKLGGFPEIAIMEDVALTKQLRHQARAIRIRQQVTTSARRWESHGYLKTIVQMWLMRLLFWLGISPNTLVRLYRSRKS